MSNHPAKPPVTFTNRNTGETSLLEQGQGRKPRPAMDPTESVEPPASTTQEPLAATRGSVPQSASAGAEPVTVLTFETDRQNDQEPAKASRNKGSKNPGNTSKAQDDIETIEQFIEHAYNRHTRKGYRLTLKNKVEKQIARNPNLDDAAKSRLLTLAGADKLLAVPRQLLLLSRDIKGYPELSKALRSFVSDVMKSHAVFAHPDVQAVSSNLPEAPSPIAALAKVVAFKPIKQEGEKPLKEAELQTFRLNAANLLVTWLAINHGVNQDKLTEFLYQAVWWPATRELVEDSEVLRTLTEVEDIAIAGLLCQRFQKQINEVRSSRDQARRETDGLRDRLANSEAQREKIEMQRDALQASLEELQTRSAAEMAEAKHQHEAERTHLRHDLEQLGGRLVRRLNEAVEMLDVGLSALRNKTPRVEVMVERAEHVVDALRSEIKKLREE